jgi:hypothetical protein
MNRIGRRTASVVDHLARKVFPATNRCHQRYNLPPAAAVHADGAMWMSQVDVIAAINKAIEVQNRALCREAV